jgi:hypothetical protein
MHFVSSPVAAGPSRHRAQIAAIAALAVILSAAFPRPAAGAAITFTPSGAPFDNDAPPDILTSPGAQITFHTAFDTASLPSPIGSVSYSIFFDASELRLLFPVVASAGSPFPVLQTFNPPGLNIGLTHTFPDPLPRGSEGVAGGGVLPLADLTFLVLPGLRNNGAIDFQILNAGTGTIIGFEEVPSPQVVSVQPVPVSEPSSLLLLGAGIAIVTRLGRRAFSAHR